MSISFSKALSTTDFLNAYNNNIVVFSSDNVLDSVKCDITIGALSFQITPINNVFRFNFQEVLSVLINPNNFQDEVLPVLVLGDDTSHVYDDSANTFLSQLVDYTITFSNDSTENTSETYKFLKSVEQLEQNKKGVVTSGNNLYMLSPFLKETANTYNVTYFEGYPFDIALLLDSPGLTTVLNQTNALSYDFNMPYAVNRLFFSDGRTTITIDDYLPLVDGLNNLKITRGADIIFVNVFKVPSIEGQYMKWLNQYGEWNHWLFNCIHKRDNKTKDLGEVNNDFDDVSETTSPSFNLGKTSQDTLTLISKNVSPEDQEVLNGIYDSPKVYYFTGIRLSQVTDVSWLALELKSGRNTKIDYKRTPANYKLQFELPQRYTMKL